MRAGHVVFGEHPAPFRLHERAPVLQARPAPPNSEPTRQASMIGYLNDFHLMMIAPALAPPVFLLHRPAHGQAEGAVLAD